MSQHDLSIMQGHGGFFVVQHRPKGTTGCGVPREQKGYVHGPFVDTVGAWTMARALKSAIETAHLDCVVNIQDE